MLIPKRDNILKRLSVAETWNTLLSAIEKLFTFQLKQFYGKFIKEVCHTIRSHTEPLWPRFATINAETN